MQATSGKSLGNGLSLWPYVDEEKNLEVSSKLAAAPLASKMCTNAGYLGHGSLEGMGVSHRPSVSEGEEVC